MTINIIDATKLNASSARDPKDNIANLVSWANSLQTGARTVVSITVTGAAPAAPVSSTLYADSNSNGFQIPMKASYPSASILPILTGAQGGISAGSAESWHVIGAASEPAYANSWVTYPAGGYAGLCFRKLASGLVVIHGAIKSGSPTTSSVFTLPVGYRPAATEQFTIILSGGTVSYATVGSAGLVSVVGNATFTNLDFSFLAEA